MNIFKRFIANISLYGVKNTIKTLPCKATDKGITWLVAKITKNKPLADTIVIESHNDFDCNGGAFYDYLIKNGYNQKYKIVWLIKNKKPAGLPDNVEAFKILRPSIKKSYFICTAKYLLCDDRFTNKVRADQISLYCTHGGCSFKNVKGLIVVPESVDYILSSSPQFDPYICSNFSVEYPNSRMLHVGYPSNDVLFCETGDELSKLSSQSYEKVILWMPTFRKSAAGRNDSAHELPFGIPLIESTNQLDALNRFLAEKSSLLVIKIHPKQDIKTLQNLTSASYSNIIIVDNKIVKEQNIDNSRLMKCADALISDYSAIAYSYLLLNRPISFVLSDLEDYKLGFSVENINDFLPGEKIYTFDELLLFIKNTINGTDAHEEERLKLMNWMYTYRDGDSCKRLSEFLKLSV